LNQFRSFSITEGQEFRKRAKLRVDNLIEVLEYKVKIVLPHSQQLHSLKVYALKETGSQRSNHPEVNSLGKY